MNAVLRYARQAMHEASDLVPPPMHPWLVGYLFPEDDCRSDPPLEAVKLPEREFTPSIQTA